MVGTTVKKVIISWDMLSLFPGAMKGEASRSQTAFTLNGKRNSIVEPAKSGVSRPLTVPWMWCNGRTWRR